MPSAREEGRGGGGENTRGGFSRSRLGASPRKIYTLNLASFQIEHPLRMQASSRFWLR